MRQMETMWGPKAEGNVDKTNCAGAAPGHEECGPLYTLRLGGGLGTA